MNQENVTHTHSHRGIWFSPIMKEILPVATIWMNLEEITLSEVSQTEKDRYCMVLLLRRIFFFSFNLFILAVLDPPCCAGSSRVVVSGGRSFLHCAGSSLCWLLLLQSMSSGECGLPWLWLPSSRAQSQWLWCTGLVAPRHLGSSQTRDWTSVSCIGRQILYHWAREACVES